MKLIDTLPTTAPGHWDTAGGREMAKEYAARKRDELAMAHVSDLALANELYLATGEIGIQTAAKERMRWLSAQLVLTRASLREMTPSAMPGKDAPCHNGLFTEDQCRHCQRVARALEVLGDR